MASGFGGETCGERGILSTKGLGKSSERTVLTCLYKLYQFLRESNRDLISGWSKNNSFRAIKY
jgi:hypothetical protein